MKSAKFAVCILMTLLIIPTVIPSAAAAGFYAYAESPRYARADSRDVYFCEKKDLNYALFTIPYTYCVEILSSDGEWYNVKYAENSSMYRALYGYCRTENLTLLNNPPENVYLNMPVTVTFKTDMPSGSLPVLDELNVTAAFYGTYRSGASDYSYVFYNGAFGYIYGAHDDYPLNEIPDVPLPDDGQPTGEDNSNTTLIIALVLVGLAAAALIILYFTSKRKSYRPEN